MDYPRKSPMNHVDGVREPLAGGGVLEVAQVGKGDLSDWVELMEVVEALCLVWPRATNESVGSYRL
jgi:hypothetical protein